MPWGRDDGAFLRLASRWIPRVLVLTRREFRREHSALMPRLERDAHTAGDVEPILDGVLARLVPSWERYYRRVFVTAGAANARAGVPEESRQTDDPDAWGPAGSAWWSGFAASLGREVWWDAWLVETLRYAQSHMGRQITRIHATTRRLVRRQLRAGLAAGESIFELTGRIDRLYLARIIPNRAEVIARTEVLTALGAGEYHATLASGFADVTLKSWLDSGDGRVRSDHSIATSTQRDIPFDEPFRVGGSLLMFPRDTSMGAPARQVVQCRCSMLERRRPIRLRSVAGSPGKQ